MRYLLAIMLAAFLASPAWAAFQGNPAQPGGFSGPGSQSGQPGGFAGQQGIVTVQQAKGMPDDARVTLIGNIVAQLPGHHDNYTFRDASGEITVDIDHKYFRGQNVTPQNTVRISGKIDKDFGEPIEIDVKHLEVLN